MKILTKFRSVGQSLVRAFWSSLDIRDFFFVGGLTMLGYGLYLLRPWLAFAVCGFMLMLTGYAMRGKE